MEKGFAYIFLRKDGAPLVKGWAGHVGWGFSVGNHSRFYCGSTENASGSPVVLPGRDNGWWGEEYDLSGMLQAMVNRNYDAYKVASVREPNSVAAVRIAKETKGRGYAGLTNNCLDHLWDVLAAYGVKDLPLAQLYPYPNQWFAMFNGEYHNL